MATQVILLERIEKLGAMGDVVSVKPGYARNFLIPQNKALRATDANIAYFESQKVALEKLNEERKQAAEDKAASFKGLTLTLIRQAGETGQLYGSIAARDIADEINEKSSEKIERNMVQLNQNIKEVGVYNLTVALHPEVKFEVKVNIARTEDEAKTQLKTGKAVTTSNQAEADADEAAEQAKAALMEEEALAAEKEESEKAAAKEAEEAEKAAAKAEAKAAKKAAADVDGVDVEQETAEEEAKSDDQAA